MKRVILLVVLAGVSMPGVACARQNDQQAPAVGTQISTVAPSLTESSGDLVMPNVLMMDEAAAMTELKPIIDVVGVTPTMQFIDPPDSSSYWTNRVIGESPARSEAITSSSKIILFVYK